MADVQHELRIPRHPIRLGLQLANMSAVYERLGARAGSSAAASGWRPPVTGLLVSRSSER